MKFDHACNWVPMTDADVDWLQGRGPMPGH